MSYGKVFRVSINLSDDEWSSQQGGMMMSNVAAEYAKANEANRPLLVMVNEHGGWYLQYAFGFAEVSDGTIVGTANDMAKFDEARQRLVEHLKDAEIERLPSIRRP